jgi:hypothetical protein
MAEVQRCEQPPKNFGASFLCDDFHNQRRGLFEVFTSYFAPYSFRIDARSSDRSSLRR